MTPSSGAWGAVRLFEDEEPSAPPEIPPGAKLVQIEPIFRGAMPVGWRDENGDHFYPGFGPE